MRINITKKLLNNWHILLATTIFFFIKLGALNFDMPYIGNADEPSVIKTALSLFEKFDIDRFDWQHANFFFQYIVIKIFLIIRNALNNTNLQLGSFFYTEPFIFYYLGRITNLVMFSVSVLIFYQTLKIIYPKNIAIIGGLMFLFLPNLNSQSFFITQDIHLTTWLLISLYFTTRYIFQIPKIQYLIYSGIAIGLSGSYKIHILVFGILLAALISVGKKSNQNRYIDHIKSISYIAISSLMTFIVINYFIFINWDTFWSYQTGKGFLWQIFQNSAVSPISHLPIKLYEVFKLLIDDISIQLLLLVIISFILLVITVLKSKEVLNDKRMRYILVNSLFALLFIVYFSRSARSGSRFYIPLYYAFIIQFCYLFILENSNKFIIRTRKYITYTTTGLLFVLSIQIILKFYVQTTDSKALELLMNNKEMYYLNSERIDDFKGLNNLNQLHKAKEEMHNIYIISEDNNLPYQLVNKIDNTNRNGPNYYVYFKN